MAAGGSGVTVLGMGLAYYFMKKRQTPSMTHKDTEPLIDLRDSPKPVHTNTDVKSALQSQVNQLTGIKVIKRLDNQPRVANT
ncbi:unnamed protein product, partial [Allacma fusca]